jgi:choline dehydrogenase
MNIAADGTRVSAARAFLHPALSRPNLTPLLESQVVKLNFQGTRCVGVKVNTDGAVKDIEADRGIDLVENRSGVGKNLQDHVLVSGVVFKYKGKMPDRPADSIAVEAEVYLSSGASADTDINLFLNNCLW